MTLFKNLFLKILGSHYIETISEWNVFDKMTAKKIR